MGGWAVVEALGVGIAVLLLAWTLLLYVPFRWRPVGLYLWFEKITAGAFTPFIAAAGLLLALVGALVGSWWLAAPAGLAAVGAAIVILRLGRVRGDLARALGPDWAERIPSQRRVRMVGRWWRGRLPTTPEPRLRQDVVFATVPGSGGKLLCDVWQPPAAVPSSGLALVYLHGGAWCALDKDAGTRPLFRHLAAQGHVIVDVAYRLFPETDLPGMVADAKRALAWLKHHGAELGVEPDRIVLAGGSAGGHLALLAAYAPDDPALTPAELAGSDPRVCGVVSLYGQADLAAHYDHTGQHKSCRPDDPQPDWEAPPPPWMVRLFGPDAGRLKLHLVPAGRLDWLVGGTPSQLPDRYAQLSPLHRVHPGCPPTLLVHGQHDEMAPVAAMRQLHQRLEQADVPVTGMYLPHTDHAFDLLATAWSPPARSAIHVLERFLAALAATDQPTEAQSAKHAHAP
ncbi:MAG TPA: alpha/beta hydrolase [Actinomycetes bacterium]|nr:alpha/beta hydrolase [Actinomycetes bacterium]